MASKSCDYHDICIVGSGCVLPHASNPEEFWHAITGNHSAISELPENRWKKRLFHSSRRNECDSSYSHYGACIADEVLEKIKRRFAHVASPSRMQLLALEATAQALSSTHCDPEKTSIYMGCSNTEDNSGLLFFFRHDNDVVRQSMNDDDWERYRDYFDLENLGEDYCRNVCINSAVLHALRKEFGIGGFSALVDAACATSLVAVALGVSALRCGETDCVITGGVDANLAIESFIVFCRTGVMAERLSIPFSRSSEGLLQGEGAVIFVLKRLSDALAGGDTILAVIKEVGVSSNGNSSSLFQLSVPDILLTYQRAYGDSEIPSLDFIEAHATGTSQGDEAELQSLDHFFRGQSMALSSVKAMIGHTKATAGAASLLKSTLMLKYRCIPPFLLSDGSRIKTLMPVYLPRNTIKRDQEILRGGVSAFGFGGINTHLYLTSYSARECSRKETHFHETTVFDEELSTIILIGRESIHVDSLPLLERDFDLQVPRKSLPQIEPLQRLAVIATKRAFDAAGIDINSLDHDTVSVICGSETGQVVCRNLAYRLNYAQMNAPFENEKFGKDIIARLRSRYPQPTKDIGPGILKNIVAGRVANYFNFRGLSCNVSYDMASETAALAAAKTYLFDHDCLVIVIGTDDLFNTELLYFNPVKLNVYLLSTLAYARRHRLPARSVMKEVYSSDRR